MCNGSAYKRLPCTWLKRCSGWEIHLNTWKDTPKKKQDLKCGFMLNHLGDLSYPTTKSTQQQLNRISLKSMSPTTQKLNMKASFTPSWYMQEKCLKEGPVFLTEMLSSVFGRFVFIFSYSAYHSKHSWSNILNQIKRKL